MGLKVTQIRSSIGTKPKQRGTLRALGLGRIGKSHVLPDKPEIRGMLAKVSHCLLYTSPSPRDATLSRMPAWA